MLMKVTHETPSLIHANTADWHYNLAFQAYDTYTHCLDDRGLYHPDFVNTVRNSLSEFHRHTGIADKLMRLH